MIVSHLFWTYFLLCAERELVLYCVRGQRIVDRKVFPLDEHADLTSALVSIKENCPLSPTGALVVGLPLRLFNNVFFTLPSAAAENLVEAVSYELTRHVPYDLDDCWYQFTSTTEDDLLHIQTLVALKESLQGYLAILSASGLRVSAVAPALILAAWMNGRDGIYCQPSASLLEFLVYRGRSALLATTVDISGAGSPMGAAGTLSLLQNQGFEADCLWLWPENADCGHLLDAWPQAPARQAVDISIGSQVPYYKSLPLKIELASAQLRRRQRLKLWLQVGAFIFLALSLVAYPVAYLMGKSSALDHLEEKLVVVRKQAETLDALRQENQAMVDRYEQLGAYLRSRPQVLDILKEITDIVDSESWLDSFEIHERRISLRGTSAAATTVLEALGSSPLVQDVKFDSPVEKKGTQETFSIVATLK